MDAIQFLTNLSIILFIGILLSSIATRLRIPEMLVLIVAGILLGSVIYKGNTLIQFPIEFITVISIIALAMIVFESTTKIKIRQFDSLSVSALTLSVVAYALCVISISIAAHYMFNLSWAMSILLSTIIGGTAPDVILSLLSHSNAKSVSVLKFESIINTPLTVLFPFLVIEIMTGFQLGKTADYMNIIVEQISPFLAKFVVGIGAGIFVGLILFKVIKRKYSKLYSPLAVFISALLAYVIAENLGGNGVLAVTSLGVFFGNIHVKEKEEVISIEGVITKALYILVFVLIGANIKLPLDTMFFVKSGVLFLIYLLVRYLAIEICYHKDGFCLKEKLFMTLVSAKGIAVATVAFALTISTLTGVRQVLDLVLIIMLYSIILSSLMSWMWKIFIPEDTKKN